MRTAAGRRDLHKIFTTFPDGWPALGLLLIRLVVAFSGFEEALNTFGRSDMLNPVSLGMAALTALISAALVLGILTPLMTAVAGLISALHALPLSTHGYGTSSAAVPGYTAVISVALLLLGPGAISLDARLFGRREIIIPDNPRSRSE